MGWLWLIPGVVVYFGIAVAIGKWIKYSREAQFGPDDEWDWQEDEEL